MGDYHIDQQAETYLHDRLYVVVYSYIKDCDYQRYIDSFRGSLDGFFHVGMITIDSYIFLTNFLHWLEYKADFDDIDNAVFSDFYSYFLEDMDTHFEVG